MQLTQLRVRREGLFPIKKQRLCETGQLLSVIAPLDVLIRPIEMVPIEAPVPRSLIKFSETQLTVLCEWDMILCIRFAFERIVEW